MMHFLFARLVILFALVDCFQSFRCTPSVRLSRHLKATDNIIEKKDLLNLATPVARKQVFRFENNRIPFAGPGYTNEVPLTLAETSRMDMARIVLSATILYLTYSTKFKGFYQKYVDPVSKDRFTQLDNGVKYRDISQGPGALCTGDKITVEAGIFYNGLEVQKCADFSFDYTENSFEAIIRSYLPFPEISSSLVGMTVGSHRQVIIPPELAYGDKGLPPFVPSNAAVTLDVKFTSS